MSAPDELEGVLAGLLPGVRSATTLARIWATVDRERAAAAVGQVGEERPGDEHLGAFARLIAPDVTGDPPIMLLEPSTEGRLAAWLARNGEGPAGRYVAVDDPAAFESLGSTAGALGIGLSPVRGGPFGRSRLVLGLPIGSPDLVLVDRRAGTIGA